MKNIITLLTLFFTVTMFSQSVIADFEVDGLSQIGTGDGSQVAIVTGTGSNTTQVAELSTRLTNTAPFQNFPITLDGNLSLATNQLITLDFFNPDAFTHTVWIRLNSAIGGNDVLVAKTSSIGPGWETLTFDFSNAVIQSGCFCTPTDAQGQYDEMFLFIDGNTSIQSVTAIDNIIGGDPEIPPVDITPPVITCPLGVTVDADEGETTASNVALGTATATDNTSGNLGNALDLDGTNDIVTVPSSASLVSYDATDRLTIEFWVNPEDSYSGGSGNFEAITAKRPEWVLVKDNAAGAHRHFLQVGSGYQQINYTYDVNTWSHVALTYDGAELRLYVNGILEVTNPATGALVSGAAALEIGGEAAFNSYYGGQVDEFRIWDVARTQAEIQNNLNQDLSVEPGLVASYNFNEGIPGGDNTSPAVNVAFDASGNSNNGSLTGFALNGASSNWVEGLDFDPTISNNAPVLFPVGTTTVTWTATDFYGNTATCAQSVTVNGPPPVDTTPPTITCPPDVTVDVDPGESTASNVDLGEPVATDPGNALDFDGIDGILTVPSSPSLESHGGTNEITIEYWVKPSNTITSGNEVLVGKRNNANNRGWVFARYNTSPGLHRHFFFFDSGLEEFQRNLPADTWSHVAITYNGGEPVLALREMRLYVNGSLEGTMPVSGNLLTGNDPLQIGGEIQASLTNSFYGGQIDEFRLWNVARTQTEIQDNLNRELNVESGLVASYHFNAGIAAGNNAGITGVSDASGNDNAGTLSGFALTGPTSNWVEGQSFEPTVSNNAPATYPVGANTVTWTATDASGNSTTCTQTVTVNPPTYPVTFTVDVNFASLPENAVVQVAGDFGENGFATFNPMTETSPGSGVYSTELEIEQGPISYKFIANDFTFQENLALASCTFVDGSSNINRTADIQAPTDLGVVCWESCEACPVPSDITFSVDMNAFAGSYSTISVAGTWNGFNRTDFPMTETAPGSGVFETTIPFLDGDYQYLFYVDGGTPSEVEEDFVFIPGCTTPGAFNNRILTVSESSVLPTVCFESCGACIDDCPGAQSITPSVFGVPAWETYPLGEFESEPGCGAGDADDDIWFSFIAQSENDMIVAQDPAGGYDAVIQVYESCATGTSLGCFNDYGPGSVERALAGGLIPGNTYVFRVYDAATGASASTDVRVQVKTFEDSELQSQYCNETYELSQSVYSERDDLGQLYTNPGVNVQGYRFRFEEQGGGLIVNYATATETPYLTLASVPGLQYGKTYDVSVSHKVRINANNTINDYWSQYGTPCPITIQATVPTTDLVSEFCPAMTDLYLEQQIQAVPVAGASQYRFNFSGPGGPFVEFSSNYTVFLYNVGPNGGPGLQYNSSVYSVTVQALVNGTWSDPGSTCLITMASQPEDTELRLSDCDGTYLADDPNFILAEFVYGATAYEWQFSPESGQSVGVQTQVTAGISLAFHLADDLDLSEGGDWGVQVRALAEGQDGSFSTSCTVTVNAAGAIAPPTEDTAEAKIIETTDIQASIYPNPTNGDQVSIVLSDLTDENQVIQVEVVDFTGKVVHAEQLANKGSNANFILDFDNKLATGMYFVNLYVNDERLVEKLTVK